MQNFIYLIGCPQTKEAAIVDPAWNVDEVLKAAEADGYRITKALVTHAHFDHVNGLPVLLQQLDVPVFVNEREVEFLEVEPRSLRKTSGGDALEIGKVKLTFLHTPGHTPGSQCFLIEPRLIAGDTLFVRSCGRCDLPGGSAEEMYRSLSQTLAKLDEKTVLYPGHNYADVPTSTIGEEKRLNPYLFCRSLQEFLALVTH